MANAHAPRPQRVDLLGVIREKRRNTRGTYFTNDQAAARREATTLLLDWVCPSDGQGGKSIGAGDSRAAIRYNNEKTLEEGLDEVILGRVGR